MNPLFTSVKPKKFLGQHFLKDLSIAERIANSYTYHLGTRNLLEIGPGTGVLTQFLAKNPHICFKAIEIDSESVAFLKAQGYLQESQIIEGDFLKYKPSEIFSEPFGIIGNFPYNIASQILFTVFENRNLILEVVCMLQKEVAQRINASPGKKANGVLSIFLQSFYEVEYLFTVPSCVFLPPPKVESAVIRLRRNAKQSYNCSEKQFITIVKKAFQQRRKILRNALKELVTNPEILSHSLFDCRAEQLNVEDFENLTNLIYLS
ncbi:MAG: 16S rRNA (adenine(1518)-N(6)/adenine(1519)-N(6))-dimethyltransferase RsmA [Cytophagales bacterium]|nr:16S rRNA (adenine(1518)-N(6)/adenine(1519)-N(6))-dimethyltransferase RsmA [Cytophagales bacterium]MDW8384523.1 16S rRNA (adenine(1518)-N(6)/adenine(1519)-N(6))-dimethyltransferase RsmA [Flammeovirgaceae bacterium]